MITKKLHRSCLNTLLISPYTPFFLLFLSFLLGLFSCLLTSHLTPSSSFFTFSQYMRNKLSDSTLVVYFISGAIYGGGGVVVFLLMWRGWKKKLNRWIALLGLFGVDFLAGFWLAYSGLAVGHKFNQAIQYDKKKCQKSQIFRELDQFYMNCYNYYLNINGPTCQVFIDETGRYITQNIQQCPSKPEKLLLLGPNQPLLNLLISLETLHSCSGVCSSSDKYIFTDINTAVVQNKGCYELIAEKIYEEWARQYMWWILLIAGISIGKAGVVVILFWKSTESKGFWNKVKELEVKHDVQQLTFFQQTL